MLITGIFAADPALYFAIVAASDGRVMGWSTNRLDGTILDGGLVKRTLQSLREGKGSQRHLVGVKVVKH